MMSWKLTTGQRWRKKIQLRFATCIEWYSASLRPSSKIQVCLIFRKFSENGSHLSHFLARNKVFIILLCVTSVVFLFFFFLFLFVPLKVSFIFSFLFFILLKSRCPHFVSISSNFVGTRTSSFQIKIVQIIGFGHVWRCFAAINETNNVIVVIIIFGRYKLQIGIDDASDFKTGQVKNASQKAYLYSLLGLANVIDNSLNNREKFKTWTEVYR